LPFSKSYQKWVIAIKVNTVRIATVKDFNQSNRKHLDEGTMMMKAEEYSIEVEEFK
jgi:hypothetical protein